MIFITAKFRVRPEHSDQWPQISAAFRDGDAGGAHVQSEHFKEAQRSLPTYLAETPRIVNMIIPQDDWSSLGEMAVPDQA